MNRWWVTLGTARDILSAQAWVCSTEEDQLPDPKQTVWGSEALEVGASVKPSGLRRRGADVWGGSKGRQRAGCWRRALSWGSRLHSFLFVVLGFWCGHAEDREQSLPGLRPEGSGNTKRYVLKNASTTKETISKVKRQPSEWGEIIENEETDKGLISKIYKQLLQLNSRKINDPVKNGPKI